MGMSNANLLKLTAINMLLDHDDRHPPHLKQPRSGADAIIAKQVKAHTEAILQDYGSAYPLSVSMCACSSLACSLDIAVWLCCDKLLLACLQNH